MLEIIIPIILGIAVPAAATILYLYFSRKKKKPLLLPPVPTIPHVKVKTLKRTKVEAYVPVEEHDPEGYGIDVISTVGYVKRILEEEGIQIDLEIKKVEYGTTWICKKCRAMYLTSYLACPNCNGDLKEYKASDEIFFPRIRGQQGEHPMFLRILPTILIDGQVYVEGAKVSKEELEKLLRKLEEDKSKIRKSQEEKYWIKFANADYFVLPKQWYFDHPVRSPYAFRIVPRDQIRFTPDGRIKIMLKTEPDIPYSDETIEVMEKFGLKVLRWEDMAEYFQKIPIIEEEMPELSTELAKQKSKEYLERLEE